MDKSNYVNSSKSGGSHDSDVMRRMTRLHTFTSVPRRFYSIPTAMMSSRFVRTVARSYATLHNSSTGKRYASPRCNLCFSHPSVRQVCQFPCLTTFFFRFGLLMLVSIANRDAQHGRSIHGMILSVKMALPFQSCLTNHPGLRNPRLPKEPLFRRRPHSSPFPIDISSVDCQKTYSAD
jgi:hypothetical protein